MPLKWGFVVKGAWERGCFRLYLQECKALGLPGPSSAIGAALRPS